MNNKHLSWYEEINNNFIIAYRAYFLHVGQAEYGPHQSGTVILFWRSCYLTMTNLQTMRKRWWAQIPQNGLSPWNLRRDPCMRTKYGLWLTCPMIGKPLRINGSSRGRRTLIVVLLSTKLELSQNVFDMFKVLPMMRFSHSYRCLKVCPDHVSSCRILWSLANGCQNCIP